MKKQLLIFLFVSLFLITLINADLITPGYKYVPVNNIITNIEDYSNYYFFTVCSEAINGIVLMEEGNIGSCYKFSKLSVYAIEKKNFDLNDSDSLVEEIKNSSEPFGVDNLLESKGFIKVLDNIPHVDYRTITTTVKSTTNYYTVSLENVTLKPSKTEIERNNLIYAYFIIPIVVLIIILLILVLRNKK